MKKTRFNEFHSLQCDLYAGHPLGFLLEKKKQASIITHSSLSLFFWSKGSRAKDLSYLANHETHKNLLSRPMTSPFFTFGNHQAMLKDGLLFEYLTWPIIMNFLVKIIWMLMSTPVLPFPWNTKYLKVVICF